MKLGVKETKIGQSNVDKQSEEEKDRLIREKVSGKPMDYSTAKSSSDLSDGHGHHSGPSSSLSMFVFFVLLLIITFGVYLLFVNWPAANEPLDNRSASLAKALLAWYEQEVASDSHHEDHSEASDHSESTGTSHGSSHHEEDEETKFYWEDTWPEPKENEYDDDDHDHDEHGDDDTSNNKDHGSGGDDQGKRMTINNDQETSGHDGTAKDDPKDGQSKVWSQDDYNRFEAVAYDDKQDDSNGLEDENDNDVVVGA